MLKRLRSVIYGAPDLAASKAFYEALLGQAPYFDQPYYVGFEVGGCELGLDPDGAIAQSTGVYWRVDALEPALARAVALGGRRDGELRDAGMEVVYTGLRATPEAIVQTAIQESCDVIGLSVLSGAHEPIAKRIKELLAQAGTHIPVLMGGVIPPDDRERLRTLGVDAVFGQEARLEEIVAAVRSLAEKEQS